jgi:hypothetical protein
VNERSQVTQKRLKSKERKRQSIRNHKRGSRTAEKHGETKATNKTMHKVGPQIPGNGKGR